MIGEKIDANKRRMIMDKFNNGDFDLILLTSGMNDYISREIKYLYLNNNSIDTITTLVHFYYGCHLRILFIFCDCLYCVCNTVITFLLQLGDPLVSPIFVWSLSSRKSSRRSQWIDGPPQNVQQHCRSHCSRDQLAKGSAIVYNLTSSTVDFRCWLSQCCVPSRILVIIFLLFVESWCFTSWK